MLKFLCRELSALGVKEPQYHFVAFIMKAIVRASVNNQKQTGTDIRSEGVGLVALSNGQEIYRTCLKHSACENARHIHRLFREKGYRGGIWIREPVQLPPRLRKMPSNQRIGRIETGTCGVHQHVNRQIGQRQFARRERIAAVYGEESHAHRENHRDKSQPVEQPRDKPDRTDDFAEDRQRERNTAADTQRIGKRGGKRIEVLPLGDAVRHQQSSENNADREQQPRIAGGIGFVRKQKSQYCIHNLGNLCSNITINAGISNTPPHNFGHPHAICPGPRNGKGSMLRFFVSLPQQFTTSP